MQALARLERLEPSNRRTAPRRKLSLGARLSESGDEAVIHDLSATGILLETTADLATSERLQIDLPEVGAVLATVVWNSGHYFGCEFRAAIPKSAVSAALLRSPFETPADPGKDEAEEPEEVADDRYSLTVRLRVILGASLLLWALILWAVVVL